MTAAEARALESRAYEIAGRTLEPHGTYAPSLVAGTAVELAAADSAEGTGDLAGVRRVLDDLGWSVALGAVESWIGDDVEVDHLADAIFDALHDVLFQESFWDEIESTLFDETFYVASWDSSSFGAMTCGSGQYLGARHGTKVYIRYFGDEGDDPHVYWRGYDVDDPDARRATVLGILEQFGGYGPGVGYGEQYEDLAPAIREITEYDADYLSAETVDVESHAEDYATRHGLSVEEARAVIDRLLETFYPQTPAEGDALWELWLEARP